MSLIFFFCYFFLFFCPSYLTGHGGRVRLLQGAVNQYNTLVLFRLNGMGMEKDELDRQKGTGLLETQ